MSDQTGKSKRGGPRYRLLRPFRPFLPERTRFRLFGDLPRRLVLRYFEDILPIERKAIEQRRKALKRPRIREWAPPIPNILFDPAKKRVAELRWESDLSTAEPPPFTVTARDDVRAGGDTRPESDKQQPYPVPSDTIGIALSGGGVRSAAFCLGALQALEQHEMIDGIDYLSTVSGGGYIGTCMTAAMAGTPPPPSDGTGFPFLVRDDPRDTASVGHLRNYSNYLLPRNHSALRNYAEAASILLRGLLANATIVLTMLLAMALLTRIAYPTRHELVAGSFLLRLVQGGIGLFAGTPSLGPLDRPFALTVLLAACLSAALIAWALSRSLDREIGSDVASPWLRVGRALLTTTLASAALDTIPFLLRGLEHAYQSGNAFWTENPGTVLAAVSGAIASIGTAAGPLGRFLDASSFTRGETMGLRVWLQRLASYAALVAAGLILPLLLLFIELHLAAWGIAGVAVPSPWPSLADDYARDAISALAVCFAISVSFQPNAYSLHRFYRDRLSKAFLFDPWRPLAPDGEPPPLDGLKLSEIDPTRCPYPIVNAALNVQGSRAANKRGRDADFFVFTPDFVGSDLTLYADSRRHKATIGGQLVETRTMEELEPRLDAAAAMAISGAAVSANMGGSTISVLSPTLSLLNVRLGYWLRNPRHLAKTVKRGRWGRDVIYRLLKKFYLIPEMLNLLDETSTNVLLTDGGHVENLGIYELLKRGCRLVIAIDAECDPSLSCPSLVRLERYARIDLGVRIDLPWDEIKPYDKNRGSKSGPHCALGHILYADDTRGLLLYVKSSLTGDEPDYVRAYAQRNSAFPHETTGDQFFSEEQFEAYRALGFHILDRALSGNDRVALAEDIRKRLLAWLDQPGYTVDPDHPWRQAMTAIMADLKRLAD